MTERRRIEQGLDETSKRLVADETPDSYEEGRRQNEEGRPDVDSGLKDSKTHRLIDFVPSFLLPPAIEQLLNRQ